MITYHPGGDLFTSAAHALVNAVNCVGVMGKGIALEFKQRYPKNFEAYYWAVRAKKIHLGDMFVVENTEPTGPKYIVNFPTKLHWKDRSRLDYIAFGLQSLRRWLVRDEIPSIALPMLGCGLGGLKWPEVRQLIKKHLGDLEHCDIQLYGPEH